FNNLGYTEIEFKNYELARTYAIEARDIAKKIGDDYQIGRSYDVEGITYFESKNYQEAVIKFKEALKIFSKLKVPEKKGITKRVLMLNKIIN
ncbi:MAG: tetratricopeptide repeat protein, partial [Bacteroidota bacterium]